MKQCVCNEIVKWFADDGLTWTVDCRVCTMIVSACPGENKLKQKK